MMYNRMRDQMMDMFDALKKLELSEAPNYKFMVALSERLKADGVPTQVAERLVTGMTVKIGESAGADKELMRRAVECYADLIVRMRDQIQKDFSSNAYDILESIAHEFALTMEF